MQVLIIFAHPSKKSFNYQILLKVKEFLENKSINFRIRDLYEEKFDPVLFFDKHDEKVREEQKYIKDSDLLIFIYPTWWGSMPAILKGYIDKVFSYGFAYGIDEDGQTLPLLKGKKCIVISTFGGKEEVYKQNSLESAIKKINQHVIFEFCGFEVLEQFFIYDVKEGADLKEKIEELIFLLQKLLLVSSQKTST